MSSEIMSYLIRTLLSEGNIRYELVEKTKDGMRPRVIEKEGPTGLITTTTAPRLHPENETRLLSLGVKDTAAQTKAVMRALAADDTRDDRAVNYDQWRAHQRWLATGERRVIVPFAHELAELIPPVAVRLRRDFGLLLMLIRAHALLHRGTRDLDDRGRIVAKVADYAAVRGLVAGLFAEGVEAAVPDTVLQTVKAVAMLPHDEVPLGTIAKALKLDKGAASRRVRNAIDRGYLVNKETAKGRPARIALGDPMPDTIEVLPHPDKLGLLRCCTGIEGDIRPPPSVAAVDEEVVAWTL